MKHKYISDDGKEYLTEQEALDADKKFEESKLKAECDEKEKKIAISKRKKELSDKIQDANKDIEEAEKLYKERREEAYKMVKDAQTQAHNILKEALSRLDKAREARMYAIKDFNDEFGAYEVRYTGSKAFEEYNRVVKEINSCFNHLWDGFPFIF